MIYLFNATNKHLNKIEINKIKKESKIPSEEFDSFFFDDDY